jgi:hypothetical protein
MPQRGIFLTPPHGSKKAITKEYYCLRCAVA